jgi:DNA-binding LacI/PurR family transcriptional regulator
MTVTIYDVAKVAGVGISTVSRVLNDSAQVSPATRSKVLNAIELLGYKPNLMARNLSRVHVRSVGVVLSYLNSPFQMTVLEGIEQTLSSVGYDLIVFNLDSHKRRESVLETLSEGRRADGLIVVSFGVDQGVRERFQRYNIPIVVVDYYDPIIPCVFVNNVYGGYLATQHLISLGHRRIGYIQDHFDPPNGPQGNWPGLDRRRGYMQALQEAGVEADLSLIEGGWGHSRLGGQRAAKVLLSQPSPPTAIFASSDILALGVLEYARSQGLHLPRDLSLIGFDDIDIASFADLTTIRQPIQRMGQQAAQMILSLMAGLSLEQIHNKLPVELVERTSTQTLGLSESDSLHPHT